MAKILCCLMATRIEDTILFATTKYLLQNTQHNMNEIYINIKFSSSFKKEAFS